jgi:hypothetical protein
MSPCSLRVTKQWATARLRASSMVKASRGQSREQPRRLIWPTMVPWVRSFQAQARSRKPSRPSSALPRPSAASCRVTTLSVAMLAWSVPGTHTVGRPRMRIQRMSMSWMALLRQWPMCSTPVTLGGGNVMTKGSPSAAGSSAKRPASSQARYQDSSRPPGLYWAISLMSCTACSRAQPPRAAR